ncbi:MAG TPA: prepilin peptidase, partial [Tepidisphaeraceae bacterium]|nr:prepilin peptidase [Tepidisphaeraceae bacterium]
MAQHATLIVFLFALGACVGSFLNVVVWRLPRGESLVSPGSHCPKCNTPLKWYDNVPVVGWLKLGGKCRFCREPISARYPIVEAVTGGLFVFYYAMYYLAGAGPTAPASDLRLDNLSFADTWPIFLLYMLLIACLLAASLIDAEQFIIPIEIPWLAAIIGFVVHAAVDRPGLPGALNLGPITSAMAAGAGVGLAVSMFLWWLNVFPTSFPDGEPMFDTDREAYLQEIEANRKKGIEMPPAPPPYTRSQIRLEMVKEMLFLLP